MKYLRMQQLQSKLLYAFLFIFTSLLFSQTLISQDINALEDIEFLESENHIKSHKHTRAYIFKDKKNNFVKYNPLSLTLGGMMYVYQNAISQQFSANCLFHPTCSEFSKQAISEYGFFKGIFLSTDRLTRCNKLGALDIHPITINEETNKSEDPISLYK